MPLAKTDYGDRLIPVTLRGDEWVTISAVLTGKPLSDTGRKLLRTARLSLLQQLMLEDAKG